MQSTLEQIQQLEIEALTSTTDITHILNSMMFLTRQFLKEEESYFENLEVA